MIKIGMLLSDRYEILEKIGSGGMSDVYKAKCHKLNRPVAVKVLKQEYSADKNFVSKFWAEAQSAACLSHSNIVNVYDVGNEQDVYYIVMELVEGITLKKYIEKKGKLEVRESIGIAMQVCQGIEAAHEQKIIHRDIKPQNIMISKDGKVKVTDFGIARAATTQTISSNAMGSVHYISPEQARGGYCDERSDIYSMGIVLYEMLTGQVPFEGESTVQVALMHIQSEMVPPTMHEPTIPVSLEKIILKCTQKKPEARYASVAALIADLRRALMTPDEDFVKIVPVVTSNDPTRVMSNEEVEQIKSEAGAAASAAPVVDAQEEAYLMGYEEEDEEEDEESQSEAEDDEDDDEEENPKFEKVITGISIVVAILIVILAVFILGRALNLFGGGETDPAETTTQAIETTTEADSKTSEMPKLVGLTLGEAEALLTERELGISVEYVAAPGEEEGIVLSQEFEEGKDVNKHYRVKVVVVDNSGIADVPMGLVGSTIAAVRKELTTAGFVVDIEEEYSDEVEEGIVISLDPGEGTIGLEKGSTIEVLVSKGPEIIMVVVPKVEGSTLEKAKSDLTQKGLKVEVEEAFSDTTEAGIVIDQSVKAGREVEIGTTVTITVSNSVKMPNIIGYTLAEAKGALERVGLELAEEYEVKFSDTVEVDEIMEQSVDANDLVEKGTKITVTVNGGMVTVPTLTGTKESAEKALNEIGLKAKFEEKASDLLSANMVVGQGTAAGTQAKHGSEITVFISSAKVNVPQFNASNAEAKLKEVGLVPKIVNDANLAAGEMKCSPGQGTSVDRGSTVTVTIGTKAAVEMVTIPALSGSKSQIEETLRNAGLNPSVTEEYNAAAAGTVISCSPAVGESVTKGSTVTVVVSKGPEMATVPALSGTLDQIKQALESAGLVYAKSEEYSATVAAGDAIRYGAHEAGQSVAKGTTVTVVVSLGPESPVESSGSGENAGGGETTGSGEGA